MPDSALHTDVIIRPETPRDFEAVAAINTLAFGSPNEAHLVALLRDIPETISLVADRQGELIGHICFSPAKIVRPGREFPVMTLAPMAVVPAYQRAGIGSRLVESGLAACRQAGHQLVIVLGHPWYYPRFGFAPAAPHGIAYPQPVPQDVFMFLELTPGSASGVSGTVKLPEAFSVVE